MISMSEWGAAGSDWADIIVVSRQMRPAHPGGIVQWRKRNGDERQPADPRGRVAQRVAFVIRCIGAVDRNATV